MEYPSNEELSRMFIRELEELKKREQEKEKEKHKG